MNLLTRRCGCGAIFSLPHVKSNAKQCLNCLRPQAVQSSPDQKKRWAEAFCAYLGAFGTGVRWSAYLADLTRRAAAQKSALANGAHMWYTPPTKNLTDEALTYRLWDQAAGLESAKSAPRTEKDKTNRYYPGGTISVGYAVDDPDRLDSLAAYRRNTDRLDALVPPLASEPVTYFYREDSGTLRARQPRLPEEPMAGSLTNIGQALKAICGVTAVHARETDSSFEQIAKVCTEKPMGEWGLNHIKGHVLDTIDSMCPAGVHFTVYLNGELIRV